MHDKTTSRDWFDIRDRLTETGILDFRKTNSSYNDVIGQRPKYCPPPFQSPPKMRYYTLEKQKETDLAPILSAWEVKKFRTKPM